MHERIDPVSAIRAAENIGHRRSRMRFLWVCQETSNPLRLQPCAYAVEDWRALRGHIRVLVATRAVQLPEEQTTADFAGRAGIDALETRHNRMLRKRRRGYDDGKNSESSEPSQIHYPSYTRPEALQQCGNRMRAWIS